MQNFSTFLFSVNVCWDEVINLRDYSFLCQNFDSSSEDDLTSSENYQMMFYKILIYISKN